MLSTSKWIGYPAKKLGDPVASFTGRFNTLFSCSARTEKREMAVFLSSPPLPQLCASQCLPSLSTIIVTTFGSPFSPRPCGLALSSRWPSPGSQLASPTMSPWMERSHISLISGRTSSNLSLSSPARSLESDSSYV